MRRLTAALAATVALTAPLVAMAPANAAVKGSDAASCTGGTNVTGSVTVRDHVNDDGSIDYSRVDVIGIINDNATRTWSWDMFHDGIVTDSGTRTGDATIERMFIDFSGAQTYRFRFENANGTIICNAKVTV